MSYAVFVLRRAQREISRLPIESRQRVRAAMERLGDEPRPSNSRRLSAREGWRVRVGDYRVIYEVDDERGTVTVLHVGHRRDVYR